MKANEQVKADTLRKLIKGMVIEFVLHPDDLVVVVTERSGVLSIRIRCHQGDVGRVIGTRGAHVNALKVLALLYGQKHKLRVDFMPIEESVQGKSDRYSKFKASTEWRKAELLGLLEQVAWNIFKADAAVAIACVDNVADSEITVSVARDEPARVVDQADAALGVIFNAIGKPNGRTLTVHVVAGDLSERRQPSSARGRFA
jgi:predicted RNA-binding protein YlqC (UPF0109 family)